MTIDKSCTSISNRNFGEFLRGLHVFLEHCKTLLDPIFGEVACPCDLCGNSQTGSINTLWTHISKNGFDLTYTIWDKHGESLPPPPLLPLPPQPPSPEYDNMAAFLDKIIRPNNESTQTMGPQPTQTTGPQPTQTTGPHIDNEFEALFSRATDKLYPGCTWMTSLDFLAKMSHAKVLGKITDSGFNLILKVLQEAFPHREGFRIPSSYYEMKKTYKKIGLGYESIHACINDCYLFWVSEENEKMQNYPICNASRWKDLKTKGKKVANKVICMKETSFMLTMLIHGPKSPAKDIDVFLQPLIRELQTLWSGVWTRDVVTGTDFKMKAALLWTINDYPARSSLSGWSGQGYLACPTCNKDTPSAKVRGKIVYVGHRKFLRIRHTMRMKRTFNGKIDMTPIPKTLTNADIMNQLRVLPRRVPGKHSSNKQKPRDQNVEFNWNKRSIFYDLEYWPTLQLKHNLDVIHIEKNVLESLLGVRLPDGFGSSFKKKVTVDDNNITGMKSHDCHIMMQRLLPYGVQQYLSKDISPAIIKLFLFFKQICARKLMQRDMEKAKEQLINIMCSLKQIYPPAFFDVMIHLVMHLPEEAILGGPVYMRWMYPFERYMKKLKNYVRNKSKPKGSIAEGYVAEEALTFCSHYLKGVETRFNRPDRNGFGLNPTDTFKGINHILTDKDSYRDQQYILATHARQVFYLEYPARRPPHWKVVKDVHHRKIWHRDVVEDDQMLYMTMACVAPRSRGGDAGGDLPNDRQPRLLPHQCKGVKKAFKQNGYRKLEIVFEAKDQKTFKPVGQYGANFSSYVGELIKEIPQYYDLWEKLPLMDKASLIPRLLTYFDLLPHLNDETVIKINGKEKKVGSLVRAGLQMDFARRYSDNKLTRQFPFFHKQQHRPLLSFIVFPILGSQSSTKISDNNPILCEAKMKAIQDAITAGTIPPKTDRQILAKVTRNTNRVYIAGVGRNLAGTGNLDSVSSISTPGGPSSSSPAPSSTPLGLGNCYTPTFDLETSQSGEQEDNGSDDGNHEYDVDIYDDDFHVWNCVAMIDKNLIAKKL
nr:hypothetical protein [Tanacetum cinerariifolium]